MSTTTAGKIEEVSIPSGSLAESASMTDYTDAFRVIVDAERFPDVDAFARVFLKDRPPSWISVAMHTRDAVVGMFGLKKSSDAPKSRRASGPLEVGDYLGIFRLIHRTESELLLGEDDKHLDFRLSLLYKRQGEEREEWSDECVSRRGRFPTARPGELEGRSLSNKRERTVTVSTVVRFNNTLGRAYFLPVRPVHRRIVPALIRSAVAAL